MPEAEDRRIHYRAICDYEIATAQMRFQTVSIFLAAVGLIVGFGDRSRALGGLLLAVSFGLWLMDLRNRDLLKRHREMGEAAEQSILGEEGLLFRARPTPATKATLGILNAQWEIKRWPAGLVAFQVGFDLIFFAVMGFGIWLLLGQRHGLWQLLVGAPLGVAVIGVLCAWRKRNIPVES